MDSLASISGLATGINFREIVDQIIEVESSRLNYMRLQITGAQAKQNAWEEARTLLDTLQTTAKALGDASGLDVFNTSVLGLNPDILGVKADGSASPGRHAVRVLQAAQREVIGSSLQASRTAALGLSGDFLVGSTAVQVTAEDSLQSIASRINGLNFGANAIGVSASVVGSAGAYRLVLSAAETGERGLGLLDTSGVLTQLGFLDGTTVLKNRVSGGFGSDAFASATTAIGTQLGFSSGAPSGTVTLGAGATAFSVALDLSTQTLDDVRDAINAAAAGAGAAMFAEVEADPAGGFRLSVTGTAAATDAGGVLQALGVLEGGRGSVSQVVQGDVLTTDAGGTPATAATALTSLFNGASPAGVNVGDTITFEGRDHSGSAFAFTHTVQGGDTLQTILTELEGANGFNGSATATISADGRLTLTSATAGSSQLSLSVFAGNEGGGVLDFGSVSVTTEGRTRQVSEGRDALLEVDGALVQSASNDITDVIEGVTFSVLGADPNSALEVVIERNAEAGVESVQAYVDALNALVAFVNNGVGTTGPDRPPLAGDSILRGIRDRINFAMQVSVPVGATGSIRMSDLGVEVTREGTFTLDAAKLTTALQQDPEGVRRALGSFGSGSTAAVNYVGAGASTPAGTYAVVVSQLGSRASVTSSGFGGAYVDDGTADTLTVTANGVAYQTSLSNGMTLAQIVDALNVSFGQSTTQQITSQRTLYSDAAATTAATDSTVLADLYHGAGQSSGFIAGTTITFSGTKRDGSAVLQDFDVTDPATQTLGQLRSAITSAFGPGVTTSIVNGQIVVTESSPGASQLSVNIGSDVAGNAAPLGVMQVTTTGSPSAGVVAEAVGSELRISSGAYGGSENFTVSFSGGGANGTGSLGLAAGSYTGTDVVGTIGGEAATGVGNVLTADTGTTAAGLAVQVSGATTGAIGSVTFSRGIMSTVTDIADTLLGSGDGSIDGLIARLKEDVARNEDRLLDREARLETRRERLIAQFVALEVAISRAQNEQQWIQAQVGSLAGNSSS
jgi:flagellar hook-associated protein 2